MRMWRLLTIGLAAGLVSHGRARAAEPVAGPAVVAGVAVPRLPAAQARRVLERRLAPRLRQKVTLSDGQTTVRLSRAELGARVDIDRLMARLKRGDRRIPLALKVDRVRLQRRLRAASPRFYRAPRDARVGDWQGGVTVAVDSPGRSLNVGRTTVQVASALEREPGRLVIRAATVRRTAGLTAARLRGINGRLARFSTRFNPGNGKRLRNIRLAIGRIDGTLLSPGEVFSLNGATGPRTQQRGYRTAPVFDRGKVLPGIGGGVSQVTGTLFNAALLAGLPIVEYGTHKRPVSYIPVGRDATVDWGILDLKFRNDTGAPIYLSYRERGGVLTATVYGRESPGRKVSVAVRSRKHGPGHITAELYRTIRRNGRVVSKERVGRSEYRWKAAAR